MRDAFPLIRRPDLQSATRRWASRTVTVVAWAVWIYLWLPLLTLAAWALGFHIAADRFLNDADLRSIRILGTYGLWIAGGAFAFLLWSAYNKFRFRGPDRRRTVPEVSAEQVAADLPLSTEAVARIMDSRKVTVRFNADMFPETAEIKIRGEERIETVR